MQTFLPGDARKLENPQEIEQVTEPGKTPLGFNLNKPKRKNKECQDKAQPIKIVIRIFEIGSPFPKNDMKNSD